MTIRAKATDADNDRLTYKLFWGTSSGSLSHVDSKSAAQNNDVVFAARTGLARRYYLLLES